MCYVTSTSYTDNYQSNGDEMLVQRTNPMGTRWMYIGPICMGGGGHSVHVYMQRGSMYWQFYGVCSSNVVKMHVQRTFITVCTSLGTVWQTCTIKGAYQSKKRRTHILQHQFYTLTWCWYVHRGVLSAHPTMIGNPIWAVPTVMSDSRTQHTHTSVHCCLVVSQGTAM